ncbi:MAG: DNA-directed RNA polymerase subunit omega [Bacilli bacterium]|nr:DNA-directed RNA polymerase subunit omega [Bacilli bacterium]
MRYPSIDQLLDKTTSKYRLVMAVAKRALEIEAKKTTYMEQPSNKKSIGLALEEINEDKVLIK